MLWLYLLGAVTILTIALRRVLRRLNPLGEDLRREKLVIEQLPTGVAWVRGDGKFGSVNPAFAHAFDLSPGDLIGHEWYKIFPPSGHNRIQKAYAETLLMGVQTFSATGVRRDGSAVWLNVRLVPVHDRNARFIGHHCLVEDRTNEHELEALVDKLSHGDLARGVLA